MFKQFKLTASLILLSTPGIAQNTQTQNGTMYMAPMKRAMENVGKAPPVWPLSPLEKSLRARTSVDLNEIASQIHAEGAGNSLRFNPRSFPPEEPLGGGIKQMAQRMAWQMLRKHVGNTSNSSRVKFVFTYIQIGGRPKRPYIWVQPPGNIEEYMRGMRNFRTFGTTDQMMPRPDIH